MARRSSDYTFQEHLERLALPQAKLLTDLRARIRGLDGRVEERIHKRRIAYSLDRDFVVILPQPRKQCLMVKLLDARYDDPRRWVQTVPKTKGYRTPGTPCRRAVGSPGAKLAWVRAGRGLPPRMARHDSVTPESRPGRSGPDRGPR